MENRNMSIFHVLDAFDQGCRPSGCEMQIVRVLNRV